MEIKPLICPCCGASLQVHGQHNFIFCEYCGTKILLNTDKSNVNDSTDNSRLRELELENQKLRSNQTLESQRLKEETKRFSKLTETVVVCFSMLILLLLLLVMHNSGSSSSKYPQESSAYIQETSAPEKITKAETTVAETEPETIPVEESSEAATPANYTIEKDAEYAYKDDEWTTYIATAVSDSMIKLECWSKTFSTEKKVSYDYDVGIYKINDSDNNFSWADENHIAFNFTFKDSKDTIFARSKTVVFTLDISDSNSNKGTDYNSKIRSYSYQNDDWYTYRAIPLNDHILKLEVWNRSFSIGSFLYGRDMYLIDLNNTDTDFEWTDADRTSFTITMNDKSNGEGWRKEKLVLFTMEDDNYQYDSVLEYLTEAN